MDGCWKMGYQINLNVTPRDENMKSSIRAKPDTAVTKGGGFGADLHHGNLPPKK